MYALVDCNNFYASCERVFNPALRRRPVVDVRTLVDHLVFGNLAFAALVTGSEPPPADADQLGPDPLAAFRAAGRQLAAALRTSGVAERTYSLPIGTVPGTALAGIRITELLGHGWDLARATGQPPAFPGDLTERGEIQKVLDRVGLQPGEAVVKIGLLKSL